MDTIKRLGEQETLNRIVTGTLKSYVDHDIDSVDTSQFLNLETLNVPKAESVVIGEGVKDTIEVLNAPKMEEVTVDSGEKSLVVNWGKDRDGKDIVTTFYQNEPLYFPRAFLSKAFTGDDVNTFADNNFDGSIGYQGIRNIQTDFNPRNTHIAIFKLPQVLGKYLYEGAETVPIGSGYPGEYVMNACSVYKGIAIYPNTVSNGWEQVYHWGVGIRKKSDIKIINRSMDETHTKVLDLTGLEDDAYYLVSRVKSGDDTSVYLYGQLHEFSVGDDTGSDHIFLRHFLGISNDNRPDGTEARMGAKYTCPSSLATTPIVSNDLSNLPNLKVANVASMDVDIPMFKGCTNLERVTIGGKKNPTEVEGVTTYPTLDSSYLEGCTNLSEVTITNPYLRFNNAIPSTVDLYADDSKLPSDGLLEYRKNGLPPVTVTMATYLQANNSGYRVKGAEEIDYPLPLGGRIFYIDPSDNGATYIFLDENFAEITGWSTISDLANAKYYKKKGASTSDKFYVYYPTKYNSLPWGYDSTSIGATGTTIGTGKTNTATVMARTDIETGTIWSKLSEIRTSSGIDDWFIPSKDEIDKFRVADLEPWHRSSGGSYLWSSSEFSASNAWYWGCGGQSWYRNGKDSYYPVFFVRAF